jgi:hypothetical protein
MLSDLAQQLTSLLGQGGYGSHVVRGPWLRGPYRPTWPQTCWDAFALGRPRILSSSLPLCVREEECLVKKKFLVLHCILFL